jgi:hypothetical protein
VPELADLAGAAAPSEQTDSTALALDRVVTHLYSAGLSLQSVISQVPGQARQNFADTICGLDAAIGEIRDRAFSAARSNDRQPGNRADGSRSKLRSLRRDNADPGPGGDCRQDYRRLVTGGADGSTL